MKIKSTLALPIFLSALLLASACKKPSAGSESGESANTAGSTTASATISATHGGYLNLGQYSLTIPQGALEADTQLAATYTQTPDVNTMNLNSIGQAVKFSPEGLQFLKPVGLKICYSTAELAALNLNEQSMMVYYQDPDDGLVAMSGSVDAGAHCVSGTIEHFSTYIAMAQALVPGNTQPTVGGANFLPATPLAGIALRVRTTITDFNGGATPGTITSAFLNYRIVGASSYTKVALQPDTTDGTVTNRYFYVIPAAGVTNAGVQYFFEATDNLGAKRTTTVRIRNITASATALRFRPASIVNIGAGFVRDLTLQANNGSGTWVNISSDIFGTTGGIGSVSRTGPSTVRIATTTAGAGTVTATSGALNAAAAVNVVPGLIDHIKIMDSNQVIVTGPLNILIATSFQFDVLSYDAYGNTSVVLPVFSTTGAIGNINASGLFTAAATPSLGSLTADIGGVTDTLNIQVVSPSISLSPTSGPVGTLLTITGTNFDLSSLSSLTVNGNAAVIVSAATGSAQVLVMPGTTTGSVTATTGAGSQTATTSFTITAGTPPATQQGSKLVGTGITGSALQGYSVALSADGNTAIVGSYQDNGNQGAAWVYARSGTTWSQQGLKLVGAGNAGAAYQGYSVALSADGNTAIIGGYNDNGCQGAAWVFVRSGGTWAQQGSKLVGTGVTGLGACQGLSVALSADGNTAIVGGGYDDGDLGAAWVFVRSGTTWAQQGSKLVGTGITVKPVVQGISVALSADGNTAIVGGAYDNHSQGAAWVFVRSGTTWAQQGSKLVGTGNIPVSGQGISVALSADGNTAIVGGAYDNASQGAAWVFARSGTTWSQQGSKLVGTGNTPVSGQGISVALSADGNTAIVGGAYDNASQGAAWVFARSGTTWSQQGSKLVGTGNTGAAQQGISVAISADGNTAIVGGYQDNSYQGAAWVFVP
jgi:hypothetical protein